MLRTTALLGFVVLFGGLAVGCGGRRGGGGGGDGGDTADQPSEQGDSGCPAAFETSCTDRVDNDCDGATDCADSECFTDPSCRSCTSWESSCTDLADNDCDGLTDCADTADCGCDPSCRPSWETSCTDLADNDCDGFADCADTDCATSPSCSCARPLVRCGSTCVNTSTDPFNCGACSRTCSVGLTCVGGFCTTAPPTFRVTGLGQTGCSVVEHGSVSGDDRGGIAVSPTNVFYSGDTSTVRLSAADLSAIAAVGTIHDGLLGDLSDGSVYVLLGATGIEITSPTSTGFAVTQLGRLDGATGTLTATRIALGSTITVTYGSGIFSGWGRAYVFNGTSWYEILLPSGSVTLLTSATTPSWQGCENWAQWGIAEYYGGERYAVYVELSTTIARYRISDATVTALATFTNLSDMCSIAFSPARNRWYFHHEYNSQFQPSTTSETVGFCSGTWDQP